jgi:hypothetical protein
MSRRRFQPPVAALDRQRGTALLIALILLAAITFLSVSAFNAGTANLRSVANSEAISEATAAAQAAIDRTISSSLFTTQPEAVAAAPIGVDIDGDGSEDYQPMLRPAPACTRVAPLRMSDLDPADAADLACMGSSVSRTSGIDSPDASSEAGKSLCANSEWLIRAQASHTRTGVAVALVQGVGVRILETDSDNFCS